MSLYKSTPLPTGLLVEPCAGSAALTMHFLGAKRAILPYQGGKWRYRHALTRLLAKFGSESPSKIILADPGPWGIALKVILDPQARRQLLQDLRAMAKLGPWEAYQSRDGAPVPHDPILYTAQFLFLQRIAHSGKAVGVRDGMWVSPGFNASSTYGLAGTERFGEVQPMIPYLIRVLEGYNQDLVEGCSIQVLQTHNFFQAGLGPNVTVYIDPPYCGTTPYPNGKMPREEVITLAEQWAGSGADVVVSEATPIPQLVGRGWHTMQLHAGRKDTSPFKGKHEEWVTYTLRRES